MGRPGKAKKQRIEAVKAGRQSLENSRQQITLENDDFVVIDGNLDHILEQWRLNAVQRESESIPLRPLSYPGNSGRTKRRRKAINKKAAEGTWNLEHPLLTQPHSFLLLHRAII